MHQQIRSKAPTSSPASLEKVLGVIKSAGLNIVAAGGSNLERGGEFGFAVDHGREDAALNALRTANIEARVVEVEVCWMTNKPGELHRCVQDANKRNRKDNRLLRDMALGVPNDRGEVPVQLFYDEDE